MKAVALTGMSGARKTDLAAMLAALSGASVRRLSAAIEGEINRSGKKRTPAVYLSTATAMRRSQGEGILVTQALAVGPSSPFLILDGLRTRAEVETLRASTGRSLVVAVHAARSQRFTRMRANSGPELQGEDALLVQDDENLRLGVGDVIALADLVVVCDRDAPPLEDQAQWLAGRILQEFGNA